MIQLVYKKRSTLMLPNRPLLQSTQIPTPTKGRTQAQKDNLVHTPTLTEP